MQRLVRQSSVVLLVCGAVSGCGGGSGPTSPGGPPTSASVLFVYAASTTARTDLPNTVEVQRCVIFVGATHIHLSWRNYELRNLVATGPDRWEVRVDGVPVNERLSIQVADANVCDLDNSGFAYRNVTANGVALTQRVPGPGGDGLAFTASPNGQVTP